MSMFHPKDTESRRREVIERRGASMHAQTFRLELQIRLDSRMDALRFRSNELQCNEFNKTFALS